MTLHKNATHYTNGLDGKVFNIKPMVVGQWYEARPAQEKTQKFAIISGFLWKCFCLNPL